MKRRPENLAPVVMACARARRSSRKLRRAASCFGLAAALGPALAAAAQAANECGAPVGSPPSVVCAPAADAFPGGVVYAVPDLTITVTDGVVIDTGTAAGEQAGVSSGGNGDFGDLALTIGSATGPGVVIRTDGADAEGVFAVSLGGAVTVASHADITTIGLDAEGINVRSAAGSIDVEALGAIATTGASAQGILANSTSGDIRIDLRGAIATSGQVADGILAVTQTGDVAITTDGAVLTSGRSAFGVFGFSTAGSTTIRSNGTIATAGSQSIALAARGAAGIDIGVSGDILTAGQQATGIDAFSSGGDVTIAVDGTIATSGRDSIAIAGASGSGSVAIDVAGEVLGGHGNGKGVLVAGGARADLRVAVGARISALSDFAVESRGDPLIVTNFGAIDGFVKLGDGADVFDNRAPGVWNLRRFADSDGDGRRDREFVAIADFGAVGGDDIVLNAGTLRLAEVRGALSADPAGGAPGAAGIAADGVEQGFLTNLEQFHNAGLVTLQDGVAGDVLGITAGGAPGAAGAGAYRSEGGALALDVVLDDGSGGSDILVLDNARTGAGGATRLLVTQVGGIGAQTIGDGIRVISVGGASDPDAFVLGGPVIAGAYQYDLFEGNLAGSDESWYLRSRVFEGARDYAAISVAGLEGWHAGLDAPRQRLEAMRQEPEGRQLAALPGAVEISPGRGADAAGWVQMTTSAHDIARPDAAPFDLEMQQVIAGFDVGFDGLSGASDRLVLGGFAGYGDLSAAFDDGARAAFEVASVGAYASYARGPFTLDAMGKFDRLDGAYESIVVRDGNLDLPVFGAAMESGYRLDLPAAGLYLQPRLALAYAHAGGASLVDDSGARIDLDAADSLRGSAGARIGRELAADNGAATGSFHLDLAVTREFLGRTAAQVSGLDLAQQAPATSVTIGGGFDIALAQPGVTLNFDVDYRMGDAEGLAAIGGIRFAW